jgi:hypothetical protein
LEQLCSLAIGGLTGVNRLCDALAMKAASLSTGYRSLDCQRIVYCRLPIVGGEGDKSDLMVFNKLATFNGFVIKAAHPLSRAIVSFHGVANAVTAMTGMALV